MIYLTIKEIFDDIHSKIRLMPTGVYSINKLSAMTGHHWNSIKEFLSIFESVQKGYFKIQMIENDNKISLEIQNILLEKIDLSDKDKFIIKLYLFEAFNADSSVQLDLSKLDKLELLEKDFIAKENLKFFLSKKGITEALFLIQTINSLDIEEILENENPKLNNLSDLIDYQLTQSENQRNEIYSFLA